MYLCFREECRELRIWRLISPLWSFLREKGKEGKRLAAICAAPAVILGMNGFLQGKKAVCYPGMEDKLLGAEVQKAAVVTDGNITTSRGMGTAIAYGLEIIRLCRRRSSSEDENKCCVRSWEIGLIVRQ